MPNKWEPISDIKRFKDRWGIHTLPPMLLKDEYGRIVVVGNYAGDTYCGGCDLCGMNWTTNLFKQFKYVEFKVLDLEKLYE